MKRVRRYGERFGIRLGGLWGGVLSIFDPTLLMGSRRYEPFKNPWQADKAALYSDWKAVGDDLITAMTRFKAEVASKK
ncbi:MULTISPECIES: hypothetical protein [Thermus]|jgi:hypothetical protein|uniref:hypothetical protein n=1 Tax=Thermus sp. TaxID=275 RepID=UPI00298F1C15|nr:hypothetical protein [Thermus sp.]MDW8358120.1 hypothetical protein [Thermus sp.]